VIDSLDFQASRLGVTRQSIIKVWIAERLKEEKELTSASSQRATRVANAGRSVKI
jgi:hypothetical protein